MDSGPKRSGCLDLETLAAFIEGRGGHRQALAAHLDRCERCYELVVEVARTLETSRPKTAPSRPSPRLGTPLRRALRRVSHFVSHLLTRRESPMLTRRTISLLAALSILSYLGSVAPANGHCGIYEKLDDRQRERLQIWYDATNRANDIQTLLGLAVDSYLCSSMADAVTMSVTERIECLVVGPEEMERQNRDEAQELQALAKKKRLELAEELDTAKKKKEFLRNRGFEDFLEALEALADR